jgi:hypothetical protein
VAVLQRYAQTMTARGIIATKYDTDSRVLVLRYASGVEVAIRNVTIQQAAKLMAAAERESRRPSRGAFDGFFLQRE